jgi:hypothetical protein
MITQQCENCATKGKKFYCDGCTKSIDYFDVYCYTSNATRFNKGEFKIRIKAYTWNDALEYVKNNLFDNNSKNKLITDCEKEFAFVELKREGKQDASYNNAKVLGEEFVLGYKIHLINSNHLPDSSLIDAEDFRDLTS